METNIVFPVLAACYALFCARSYFLRTLPLFVPSIAFFAAHKLLIHKQASGAYKMHFDTGILKTFGSYWAAAMNPLLPEVVAIPRNAARAGAVALTVRAGGVRRVSSLLPKPAADIFLILVWNRARSRFVTLPLIGIAMLGGYAFATAHREGRFWHTAAVALLAFFLLESVPSAQGAAN